MEIEITCHGDEVRVTGRGSQGKRTREHGLGPSFSVSELTQFRVGVGNDVARSTPLAAHLLEQTRALHQALFHGELHELFVGLSEAATAKGERLLVRLMIQDPRLQSVPWEAACRPQSTHGFLGTAADVVVARGVSSMDPCEPREIRLALKVLPILAVDDRSALQALRTLLTEHIASGAVELLEPIEGPAARNPVLFERLRRGPSPHVLHFLGHGGLDHHGVPVIRLADDDHGEKVFVPVEVFAEELRACFNDLRLVYLQACSGARPGIFASAAEILTRRGVDAVVAHLWPVKAEVARAAAHDFYRTLVDSQIGRGDVGASIQASRRTLSSESAEAFSPVLYLRGPDTQLFELEGRRLRPPAPRSAATVDADALVGPFARIAGGPFSLILGNAWDDASLRETHGKLRESLLAALKARGESVEATLPLYSLAQRVSLLVGAFNLGRIFQKILGGVRQRGELPVSIDAVAALLRPGVHTTLLWLPLLEHALLRHHPDRAIYVIQPGAPEDNGRRLVTVKAPAQSEWKECEELPRLRLEESFVILRLYGGYTPEAEPILTNPQVTEDDHIQGLFDLRYVVPPEWEGGIMGWLRTRPALCLGISTLDWRHRMMLRWLFDQRPPPAGSVAVLGESQHEKAIWEAGGAVFPGPSHFTTVRAPHDALVAAMRGVCS
ncbi:CHAT domain-containing protein [Nannocystis sp. SCPEA4]|uniref:CHAT domain-containing protein n=1 Tax=Nannocystis sp. SCPEA4 TaxID=2996787 RepID=UPI00226F8F5B|nr:CHAT domain-containing protein [Nannocystis sp. SCPEA4]MCY1061763.1 CHAT domain-containing protein [Nannocystis sp. SCPEA4]